jgi:hypothetical protein
MMERSQAGTKMSGNPEEAQDHQGGKSSFEQAASETGLIREFWEFLLDNKKFWLIPIVVVLFLLGLLIALGGSSASPFIYTLF